MLGLLQDSLSELGLGFYSLLNYDVDEDPTALRTRSDRQTWHFRVSEYYKIIVSSNFVDFEALRVRLGVHLTEALERGRKPARDDHGGILPLFTAASGAA